MALVLKADHFREGRTPGRRRVGRGTHNCPPRKVREPCAARIIIGLLVARPERNDARGHVADRSRLSQYFLHTRIWLKGLPFSMPMDASSPSVSGSRASDGSS
jgi:hypothetical protein